MGKRKKPIRCALCGAEFEDEARALGHKLVAHGPLKPDRKRRRVKRKLPELHRRLEQKGFGEAEAHIITQTVAEELRKEGMV